MSKVWCSVVSGAALSRTGFFSRKCTLMLWGFAAMLAALTVLVLILSLKGQLRSWPLLCQVQHKKRRSGKRARCNSIGWLLADKPGARQCYKDPSFAPHVRERGRAPVCCSSFWPGCWWQLPGRHQALSSKWSLLSVSVHDENWWKYWRIPAHFLPGVLHNSSIYYI